MNELEKLTLPELLDRLHDITVPEPVPYTPQTMTWYVLAVGLLLVLFLIAWRIARSWQANRYRREALAELKATASRPGQDKFDTLAIADLARLLRRTALTAFPRADVASLYGNDWLAFLDRTGAGTSFTNGPGRKLASGPYKIAAPMPASEYQTLTTLVREWIGSHRAYDRIERDAS